MLRRFAGEDHELPAVASLTHQHTGCGAIRIADLKIGGGQLRIVVHQHIDDQPGFLEIEVFKRDPGGFPHGRARAICRHQIAGADRPLSLRCVHLRGHAVAVVREGRQVPTAVKHRTGLPRQRSAQRRFHRGLVDHVGNRPAARPGLVSAGKAHQQRALGIEKVIVPSATAGCHHLVRNARFLQDAHAFMVDMRRTRQRKNVRLLLRHNHGDAAFGEQHRERDARRAAACNQDIAVEVAWP